MGQPSKVKPPHCVDCGATKPMAVLKAGREPDLIGGMSSHEWVCGSCLYLRDHPNAEPARLCPRERRPKALQKERLFDV